MADERQNTENQRLNPPDAAVQPGQAEQDPAITSPDAPAQGAPNPTELDNPEQNPPTQEPPAQAEPGQSAPEGQSGDEPGGEEREGDEQDKGVDAGLLGGGMLGMIISVIMQVFEAMGQEKPDPAKVEEEVKKLSPEEQAALAETAKGRGDQGQPEQNVEREAGGEEQAQGKDARKEGEQKGALAEQGLGKILGGLGASSVLIQGMVALATTMFGKGGLAAEGQEQDGQAIDAGSEQTGQARTVDINEATAQMDQNVSDIKNADLDGDGNVTEQELQAEISEREALGEDTGVLKEASDSLGEGESIDLDRVEAENADMQQDLAAADIDGDGKLNSEELAQVGQEAGQDTQTTEATIDRGGNVRLGDSTTAKVGVENGEVNQADVAMAQANAAPIEDEGLAASETNMDIGDYAADDLGAGGDLGSAVNDPELAGMVANLGSAGEIGVTDMGDTMQTFAQAEGASIGVPTETPGMGGGQDIGGMAMA